jgi:hypothetical protein
MKLFHDLVIRRLWGPLICGVSIVALLDLIWRCSEGKSRQDVVDYMICENLSESKISDHNQAASGLGLESSDR